MPAERVREGPRKRQDAPDREGRELEDGRERAGARERQALPGSAVRHSGWPQPWAFLAICSPAA